MALFGKKDAPKPDAPAKAGLVSGLKAFLKKDLELTRARWSKAVDVLRSHPQID